MKQGREIELKLKIADKKAVVEKLLRAGAVFKSKKNQVDILYNSKYFDFGDYDQSLRLRIEKWDNKQKATLAFKGTPKHTADGHKIRDEFETPVDPGPTRKLLKSIGFEEVAIIEKVRAEYQLDGLQVVIDELKFGTFIEFEGAPDEIENVRRKLGLAKFKPVHEGYIFLQLAWEQKRKLRSVKMI